jgi:hypothetical protein
LIKKQIANSLERKEIAMKPKPEIDPDFATAPWRSIPRTIARWLLIFVVITAGIALIPAEPTRPPQASAQASAQAAATPAPENLKLTLQQPPPASPAKVAGPQPRADFVVMASPSIDPQMVHPAPEGIDEGMVAHFRRDRRAAPFVLVEPPRNKPGQLPLPVPPNSEDPDAELDPEVSPEGPLPSIPR